MNSRFFFVLVSVFSLLLSKAYAQGIPTMDPGAIAGTAKSNIQSAQNMKQVVEVKEFADKTNASIGSAKNSVSKLQQDTVQKAQDEMAKAQELKSRAEERKAQFDKAKAEAEAKKAELEEYKKQMDEGVADSKGAIAAAKEATGSNKEPAVSKTSDVKKSTVLPKKTEPQKNVTSKEKDYGPVNKPSREVFEVVEEKTVLTPKNPTIFGEKTPVDDDFAPIEVDENVLTEDSLEKNVEEVDEIDIKKDEAISKTPKINSKLLDRLKKESEANKNAPKKPARVPFSSLGGFSQKYAFSRNISFAQAEIPSEGKIYNNEVDGQVLLPQSFVNFCETDAQDLLDSGILLECVIKIAQAINSPDVASAEKAKGELDTILSEMFVLKFASNMKDLNDAVQYGTVMNDLQEDMFPSKPDTQGAIAGTATAKKQQLLLLNKQNKLLAIEGISQSLNAIKGFGIKDIETLQKQQQDKKS